VIGKIAGTGARGALAGRGRHRAGQRRLHRCGPKPCSRHAIRRYSFIRL